MSHWLFGSGDFVGREIDGADGRGHGHGVCVAGSRVFLEVENDALDQRGRNEGRSLFNDLRVSAGMEFSSSWTDALDLDEVPAELCLDRPDDLAGLALLRQVLEFGNEGTG